MKKSNFLIRKFALVIFLIVSTTNTFAQISKVAIVNVVDTTLLHIHYGTTIFTNKTDTINLQFNCKKYIEKELLRFLTSKYEVSQISIPDSVLSKSGSIYDFWGLKKSVKEWVKSLKSKYDLIIYVESAKHVTFGYPASRSLSSSGLFSQGNPIKSWAAAFTTVSFTAFKTPDTQTIDYGNGLIGPIKQIKGFKFSKDKITIDPEMLPIVKDELIKKMDHVIEEFLTTSYILPKDAYDSVKSMKTE